MPGLLPHRTKETEMRPGDYHPLRALQALRALFGFCALVLLALLLALLAGFAHAEPWLAVRTGAHCAACHVNPTGGGLRTPFGTAYGNTTLPAASVDGAADWDGRLGERLAVGGDLRTNFNVVDVPNRPEELAFGRDEVLLYAEFALLRERLSLYIDQRVAPGAAANREFYALFRSSDQAFHVKAGRLFLPYGLRLEDDSAFVRQATGITMASSDDGVEAGWQRGAGAVQLAVTNGAGGGAETDKGKQWSLHGTHVSDRWRVGASANFNDGRGDADRRMHNVYAGLRTGPVAWLAEADFVVDDTLAAGRRKQEIGLVEANVAVAAGHNLKLSYEYFDPDTALAEDERTRASVVWEYTPMAFVQLRAGLRASDGIPQNDVQNQNEGFVQLHLYF